MTWNLLAKLLAQPPITDWLIRRAKKTPYTPILKDGEVYMERYWLFNPYQLDPAQRKTWMAKLPSIRLHWIRLPDRDRHKHSHPWHARTLILRGWYKETRLVQAWTGDRMIEVPYLRRAGTTAPLRFDEYHAIDEIGGGGVWTMFITWKYQGTWGFLVDGKKVPWKTYLGIK